MFDCIKRFYKRETCIMKTEKFELLCIVFSYKKHDSLHDNKVC